jgi:hypothetical membrane protein
MISTRAASFFGIFACLIVWPAMLALGAMRPSYSQITNYISELGAIGTPNAAAWNIIGFILPGVLLTFTGKAICESIGSQSLARRAASWLLVVFGISIAGQGVFPAVMEGGQLVVNSWHTRTHLLMSLLSGAAWIAALILLIPSIRRDARWQGWHVVNIVAVLLVLIGSSALRGRAPEGLSQRAIDVLVFGWFLAVSIKLLRLDRSAPA